MKEITELDEEEEEEKNPETEPKEKDITKSTLVLNPPENNESNNKAQDQKEKEKDKITIEDLNEIIGVDINNNPENINEDNTQYQQKTTRSLSHDEMIDKELEQIKQKNLSKYLKIFETIF